MQGSIQIALTRRPDGNLLPAINAKYPKSQPLGQEDPRDELIESFVEELQHTSSWATIEFNEPESSPYKFFRIIPVRGDELLLLFLGVGRRMPAEKFETCILNEVNSMAEQSLDPESFEAWEKIKGTLLNRRNQQQTK